MSKSTVSAAEVRSFFLADERRMSRLSEAGQANVRATRGRLSAEVVADHDKRRRTKSYAPSGPRVATGAPKGRPLTAAGKARREAREANQALRERLRAEGHEVGKRGRIPNALKG